MPYIGAFFGFFAGFLVTAALLTVTLQTPFRELPRKIWVNEKLGMLAYLPPIGGLIVAFLGWQIFN